MPDYRRVFIKGGTYFFTLVTYQRQKLFQNPKIRLLLQDSIAHVMTFHPFTMVAYCVLPDHIHFIWTLPENDSDYSTRIGLIKAKFSKQYHQSGEYSSLNDPSRIKRREAAFWRRRFWEHLICDEQDLERHIDYIHYNPVKHGLVEKVMDWSDSSFGEYVRLGFYEMDWGEDSQVSSCKSNFGE